MIGCRSKSLCVGNFSCIICKIWRVGDLAHEDMTDAKSLLMVSQKPCDKSPSKAWSMDGGDATVCGSSSERCSVSSLRATVGVAPSAPPCPFCRSCSATRGKRDASTLQRPFSIFSIASSWGMLSWQEDRSLSSVLRLWPTLVCKQQ